MRTRRHGRIRGKIQGTADRPRLSVFRSAKHLALQLIDDEAQRTIVGITDEKKTKKINKGSGAAKVEKARAAGKVLAEKALAKGIKKVVFDRGGYAYHGRVRAVAEGAREGGLQF
ncbi:MAG: 50S ribosomal protein L18 [bacterium]|nr:50S ribosomal protein L18 [bacterium]